MLFWILVLLSLPSVVVVNAQSLPTPRVIVTVGDSYAAGNGAGNYMGGVGECFRSSTTWGAQFSQKLNSVSSFTNVACSGGRFTDIFNARSLGNVDKDGSGLCPVPPPGSDEVYTDFVGSSRCGRSLKAQIESLNSTVDIVLLAMGGNDMQFENLVKKCLIGGLRDASDCQDQINFVRNNAAAWTSQLADVLGTINQKLKPTARVILLQFPHIVQNVPFTFTQIFGNGRIEITNNLRSLGTVLDDAQRAAVKVAIQVAGRDFVLYYDQVKALFEGHEPHPSALADNPSAWVYEGSAPQNAEIYHLNARGHAELGNALFNYVVPLIPPVPAPTAAPVAPAAPVFPPTAAPVTPPVTVPSPVAAPVAVPVTPPVTAPVTPPVAAPVVPPVKAPVTTPVSAPAAPDIAPASAPVVAPTPRVGFFALLFRLLFGWLF